MKRWITGGIMIAMTVMAMMLSGCGGKTGADTNSTVTGSNWDQMQWDKGQWK
jgi:hypothetical protein